MTKPIWLDSPAAAAERLAARLADRTPCVCGREATQCIVGPPSRWVCDGCWQAALVEQRQAAQERAAAEQRTRGAA